MTETPLQPPDTARAPAGSPWRRRMGLALILVVAAGVATGLRVFVYESAVVVGRSMAPTLESGEYLLACKQACLPETPRRGQVVTFQPPGAPQDIAIKRVIGLPGDWVQVWGKQVLVNGARLEESYIRADRIAAYPLVHVPADSIFVLGDNRDNSEDSRLWGPIPLDSMRGTAVFTYFPLGRARRVR